MTLVAAGSVTTPQPKAKTLIRRLFQPRQGENWRVVAELDAPDGGRLQLLDKAPEDVSVLTELALVLTQTSGESWLLASYPEALSPLDASREAGLHRVAGAADDRLFYVSLDWHEGEDFASLQTHLFLYALDQASGAVWELMHRELNASNQMDACVVGVYYEFVGLPSGDVRYVQTSETTYNAVNDPAGEIECDPKAAQTRSEVIEVP